MGLDMYLSAETYLPDSDVFGVDRKVKFGKVTEVMGAAPFIGGNFPSATVSVSVAYWRKANAIHRWFVENVQNGEDNCARYYVSREKLAELLGLCREVKDNPEKGSDVLPSQEGFFFGSTNYDEWYMQDIDGTIEQIENVLKNTPDDWDIYYQSSW